MLRYWGSQPFWMHDSWAVNPISRRRLITTMRDRYLWNPTHGAPRVKREPARNPIFPGLLPAVRLGSMRNRWRRSSKGASVPSARGNSQALEVPECILEEFIPMKHIHLCSRKMRHGVPIFGRERNCMHSPRKRMNLELQTLCVI